MNANDFTLINGRLKEKIKLLNQYEELTKTMSESDLEKITEQIAQRQVLIQQIDNASADIKDIVKKQTKKEQKILSDIISFKSNDANNEFNQIYHASKEIEQLLIKIATEEKDVELTIENIKQNLEDEMLKSNKGKQVIDYFNAFAAYNIKGKKFDSLT